MENKIVFEISTPGKRTKAIEEAPYWSSKRVFEGVREAGQLNKEVFLVLFLSSKNKLIKRELCSWGTVDSAAVYPREIARAAITCDAMGVILIHNHPSGDPQPSESDKQITKDIYGALRIFGIKVLDHVIVGDNVYSSFADQGLIDESAISTYAKKR